MAMQPMFMIPNPYPKVQLALSNPQQWNAEWENIYELSAVFTKPDFIMRALRHRRQRHTGGHAGRTNDRLRYTVNYETTCEIQHRIGAKTLEAFVNSDFENRWLSASVEERRKHALIGLANGGAQAKNLNEARAYCPDILRMGYLADDGPVLLKLLKDITPQDISFVPKEPYYFPNADWDALRAHQRAQATSEDDKFDLMEVCILRTKLIYLVVEGVMASFLGVPLPKVTVQKERDRRPQEVKKEDMRSMKREYATLYGEEGERRLREELAALDERRSRREVHCENCERKQGQDEKFMRCKKCWDTNQRDVKYCGKDCQIADWKARHKRICGTTVETLEDVLSVMRPRSDLRAPAVSQFGPPRNGFKRTPQLVYHIRKLDMKPHVDLVLHLSPGQTFDFQVGHSESVQVLFRNARKLAFEDGDREATAKMCYYVIWFLRAKMADLQDGWDLNHAVDQMEKEFAFVGLRRAMKELDELRWADELTRPPLMFPMNIEEWGRFFFAENGGPFGGKIQLGRPMDESLEVVAGDSRVLRAPGIWEGPHRVVR